ncbi:MAG: replication-associated recombination protein A [Chlamydiae bacterium]|nr:replication-associated recombination protein A [Chlamydiota bacterium]MBI3265700.1 replication-associated recombination protein A [Chlamydiota bacterium]
MQTPDLFIQEDRKPFKISHDMPLASRMRPRRLEEFVGQAHLMGKGEVLERLIHQDAFGSFIFYGPPGTGKTTLAHLIAQVSHRRFIPLSAVTSNVTDLRRALEEARKFLSRGERTILFVDEIHRFNKAQQDVLLPHIENGTVAFMGATTHNPFFSIVAPLVSRSQVYRLKSLTVEEVRKILEAALKDEARGLGKKGLKLEEGVLEYLAHFSEGDARRALNLLEMLDQMQSSESKGQPLSKEMVLKLVQEKPVHYDWDEDEHYDTISAFIKSVRGSDPDAALYWLAKMLEGGEDILFIARRLVILASEDIGNADPQGLTLATSCLRAVQFIGLPEARIPLAQATVYLACAPKSNAAYLAIDKALEAVRENRVQKVPAHLKNVKAPDEKGFSYQYSHDFEGHFVEQDYLERPQNFLQLSDNGYELEMAKRLNAWRKYPKKTFEKPFSKPEKI